MMFQFYLPEEEQQQEVDVRFLPSILFSVLARDGMDVENHFLQGVFSRRIAHIMKVKIELTNRFKTQFVIPIGKDRIIPYYIDVTPESFFNQPEYLTGFEMMEYLVRGALSLDKETLSFQLYSREENKVLFERSFSGKKEDLLESTNQFIRDLLLYFEITPGEKEQEIINEIPVRTNEAFIHLMEALDVAPENNVGSSNDVLFIYYLKRALEADPQSSYVATLLAEKGGDFLRLERPTEAEELENFVLDRQPLNKAAHLLKTASLIRQRKFEGALRHIDDIKGLSDNEKLRDVAYILARNLIQTEDIAIAEPFFEKALDLGFDGPDFYDSYTYYLAHVNNYQKALDVAFKGLDISPHRELTLMHAAQLLTLTGSTERADSMYKHALNFYPHSPKLLASRAIFYLYTKEYDKVENFINEALDLTPENQEINLEGARIFHELNDDESAERLARTAIDLNPSNFIAEDARYFLSRVGAGITEEEQKENRSLYIQALRLLERGETDKSKELLIKVTQKEPLFWDAWFVLAIVYRKQNNLEDAIKALTNVDELFPDQVALHHEFARCYMGVGDFVAAFPHMFYAFRKHPEDPIIMANMGILYMFLGKLQEAEALLYQAKRMAPALPVIDQYLKQLQIIKKRKQAGGGNGGNFPEH